MHIMFFYLQKQKANNELVQEKQRIIDEIKSVLKTKELIIEQQEAELKECDEKSKHYISTLEKKLQDLDLGQRVGQLKCGGRLS